MAGERFPDVQAGQPITDERANAEGRVLERMARMTGGTGLNVHHGNSFLDVNAQIAAKIKTLLVTDDADAPVYVGTVRQYSFVDDSWSDGTKPWNIDTGALGSDFTLSVGDYVSCYYDRTRGMFVPISTPGGTFEARWGKVSLSSIAPQGTGTVSLWQGSDGGSEGYDEDSGEDVTATMSPCISGTLNVNTWVLVVKMNDQWMIWDHYC